MKNFKLLILALLTITSFSSCEEEVEAPGTNYITFGDASYSQGVDPGGTATVEVPVYTANITGADRTFNIVVDPSTTADAASYTWPSTVVIPGGSNEAILSVGLSDTNLDCFNDLAFSIAPQPDLSTGVTSTITYFQIPSPACANEVSGTLDFVFDGFASEVSWEIRDVLGGLVTSGPATPYADGEATDSVPVTLCFGRCYSITVFDAFGDGLSFPADGSFTLTLDGVVYATGGGNYGSSASVDFQIN